MIYTNNTEKAMKLAFEKHNKMVDKAGIPYIIHPILVAEKMDDEDSTVVALLHDVVEDTDLSIEDIKRMGFNEKITDALKVLSHDDNVEYLEYIKQVAKNDIAKKVKIADIKHNSDLTRLRNNPELIEKFSQKYPPALEILESQTKKDTMRGKYLPIGTIVLLKGGKKKIMITGYCSVPNSNQSILFDYSGCMYPEGFLSNTQTALFNHSQIKEIIQIGYEDDEAKEFNERIINMIQAIKDFNPQIVEKKEDVETLI